MSDARVVDDVVVVVVDGGRAHRHVRWASRGCSEETAGEIESVHGHVPGGYRRRQRQKMHLMMHLMMMMLKLLILRMLLMLMLMLPRKPGSTEKVLNLAESLLDRVDVPLFLRRSRLPCASDSRTKGMDEV